TRSSDPFVLALAAFLKTLRKEEPRLYTKHVEIDRDLPDLPDGELARLVAEELGARDDTDVRRTASGRFVRVFEPLPAGPPPPPARHAGSRSAASSTSRPSPHSLETPARRRTRVEMRS